MPKITTFLSYEARAEEAVELYVSLFPDSRVLHVSRYGDAGPGPKGSVMTIQFQLAGRDFVAMNGGPEFKFSHGVSLSVECETQDEVDRYWDRLSDGGQQVACGWLTDCFGLSWQITPRILIEYLHDPDARKAQRVMQAMMQMKKLDIAALKRAYQSA